MALLEINNLNAYYGTATSLSDISLSVAEGEIIGIVGANGAGKSTLLDCLFGLVKCNGSIYLEGENIFGKKPSKLVQMGLGYAPERAHLFPYMSVENNLLVGSHTIMKHARKNLSLVFDLFPVLKDKKKQETNTLSGGQRQMVSLGRALMSEPKLLLVDEPTIGLAPKVCKDIADALKNLNENKRMTILITEQNANFVMNLAHYIHVFESGKNRVSGSVKELRKNHELDKAYFGTRS